MKLNGSITVKKVKLPGQEEGNDIVINYEVSFGIGEIGQAVNMMDNVIDKVAECARKVNKYQEEFNPLKKQEATNEEMKQAVNEAFAEVRVNKGASSDE